MNVNRSIIWVNHGFHYDEIPDKEVYSDNLPDESTSDEQSEKVAIDYDTEFFTYWHKKLDNPRIRINLKNKERNAMDRS